jgi:hypothetical protein
MQSELQRAYDRRIADRDLVVDRCDGGEDPSKGIYRAHLDGPAAFECAFFPSDFALILVTHWGPVDRIDRRVLSGNGQLGAKVRSLATSLININSKSHHSEGRATQCFFDAVSHDSCERCIVRLCCAHQQLGEDVPLVLTLVTLGERQNHVPRVGKRSKHSAVRERDGMAKSGLPGHLTKYSRRCQARYGDKRLVASCDVVPLWRNAV